MTPKGMAEHLVFSFCLTGEAEMEMHGAKFMLLRGTLTWEFDPPHEKRLSNVEDQSGTVRLRKRKIPQKIQELTSALKKEVKKVKYRAERYATVRSLHDEIERFNELPQSFFDWADRMKKRNGIQSGYWNMTIREAKLWRKLFRGWLARQKRKAKAVLPPVE